jgi:hypothetical protein
MPVHKNARMVHKYARTVKQETKRLAVGGWSEEAMHGMALERSFFTNR